MSLHVLFVSRRSWPQTGGSTGVLMDLAEGLAQEGVEVTWVSPRWQHTWPLRMQLRGVHFVRLPHAPKNLWSSYHYLRALARNVREHATRYDVAYVSELKQDARLVSAVGRAAGLPVVLRAEQSGLQGDCYWQLQARCGPRIKRECMRAAALLAPTRQIEEELIAAGYPRERIMRCTTAVRARPARDAAARLAARGALAEIHAGYAMPGSAPLALGMLDAAASAVWPQLLGAWPGVLARWPAARLWLVGEGPERRSLLRLAEQLGVLGSVAFPGMFEDADDLLAAADVIVAPADATPPAVLLAAMQLELPIVAVGEPNEFLSPETAWFSVAHAEALGQAISGVWTESNRAAGLALSARRRVLAEFKLELAVREHLTLFRRLTATRAAQVPA